MRILNSFLFAILTLFLISACSTRMVENLHSNQVVLIESIPSVSDIYINGDLIGSTPMELRLRSDLSHEIHFKKEGFKSTVAYLNTVYKYEKPPFVQFGMAKELGYYYKLSADHLIAELPWGSLPETAGISPFESMSGLIAKADSALASGSLSADEHKIILHQIIEFFNSN